MTALYNRSLQPSLQQGIHLWNGFEEIRYESVICDLEYRCVFVFVDRDDHLTVLHTSEMLDSTANSYGDIKVGSHNLTGLSNLHIVGHKPGINRGTRGTDGSTQFVCNQL